MDKKINQPSDKRILTGCTLIDLVVGGGQGMGFPPGKIINIVGDKSSGKTFFACEVIARNFHQYKSKFKFNYDDCEEGFTFDPVHLYGINMIKENTYQSETVQDWDVHCSKFLNSIGKDEIGIYVLDSLDALTDKTKEDREKERERRYDKGKGATNESGTYSMDSQKFLSQEFFRNKTRQFVHKHILLLIISQTREKINAGPFEKKQTRAGGKALDFYAHTCLWLAHVSRIIKEDRAVGIVVEASAEKSKTPRPFRKCRFVFYFDYGIDNIGSNLDYLFDLRSDNGSLNKNSREICWTGKLVNLQNLVHFLKDKNIYEKAREEKKKDTGSSNLSVEWMREWIPKQENLKKDFEKDFGTPMTRDELIEKIEKDPKMEKELEQRVIDKWEKIEESIKTPRKRKYS